VSFFRRIRDNINNKRMPKAASDVLFSLSSSYVTLEVKLGLKVTGRCALTFKAVSNSDSSFYEMGQDIGRFLGSLSPEFDLVHRTVTDTYGYTWITMEGKRIEDLLAGITAVSDMFEEKGFSNQLLAAVFEFSSEREQSGYFQYLIYNYKRNNFYPFAPTHQKNRNTEQEMQIMAMIGEEVPFEKDMSLWYPLWDLPLRPQG
jgi:hypothetical protein